MKRETIETELRSYRVNAARLAVIRDRKAEIEQEIALIRDQLREDPSGVGAQVVDGLPHGEAVASIPERMTIRLMQDPIGVKELRDELAGLRDEESKVRRRVSAVDRWLSALEEREDWIVQRFYMDGLSWRIVRYRYENEFGTPLSERQAKHLRSTALQKIERVSADFRSKMTKSTGAPEK